MSYDLSIERAGGLIFYKEWLAAIEQTDGVRLCDPSGTPDGSEGTAEQQYDAGDGQPAEWIPTYYWNGGSITIPGGGPLEETLPVALRLAGHLSARISGEQGEVITSIDDLFGG